MKGSEKQMKPVVKLVGTDGNVFIVIGTVSRTLRRNGLPDKAIEFSERAIDCESYDEVLRLVSEYVEVE